MKMLCFIIYTLSVLTTSCTHIRHYSTFDEINTITKDKNAKITLKNEQDLIGNGIYIAPDSTFWLDPNTGNKKSIITSEVSSIVLKNRGRGALEGLGLGLLGGAAIGALIGLSIGAEPGDVLFTTKDIALIGGIFGGGIGGLLGLLRGSVVGSNDKFIIDYKEKFDVDLSSPLVPNSIIKLEVPSSDVLSVKNLLESELSSKGFNIVSEGQADYILRFLYDVDKNNRLTAFKVYVINSSTEKIEGVAYFPSEPTGEIIINDLIKEFVNQLCPNMK